MPSSSITWRLETPSTRIFLRISVHRSMSLYTPFPPGGVVFITENHTSSREIRGVSHFSTAFLTPQTVTLLDRRLHSVGHAGFSPGYATVGVARQIGFWWMRGRQRRGT